VVRPSVSLLGAIWTNQQYHFICGRPNSGSKLTDIPSNSQVFWLEVWTHQ